MHNIMIIQDLLKHYGRKNCPSSTLVKMDLRKAYDTVEWTFLEEILCALNLTFLPNLLDGS